MGRAAERFRQNCPFLRHLRLKEITLTARKFLELSNFGRKLGRAGDCPQTLAFLLFPNTQCRQGPDTVGQGFFPPLQ